MLRDITAPAHRASLRWAVRVRWLAIGGFSALALLAWQLGVLAALWPGVVAGTGAALVNAANQICVSRGRALRAITAVALSADVVLITFLIVTTGGTRSPFVMLYVVQVVATALLVDTWIAAAVALVSTSGLTAALALGCASPGAAPPAGDVAAQVVYGLFLLYCLGLLTFVAGYIADRVRRSEGDRDAARAALRRTEAQLVQSEKLRALGQFVAGIAHELNNPLGFVAANLDLVRRAAATWETALATGPGTVPDDTTAARLAHWRAELPGILDDCAEGVRRAAEIVAALRAFARADRGETWAEVDLHERLDRALALFRHRLAPGIAIERAYGALPAVACLPGQLDQVFVNLLGNALDALAGQGTIAVRTAVAAVAAGCAAPGPYALITVADSGPGMPADVAARIFEPFYTTKPEGQGTGLGLSVSFGIVERHGGAIRVDTAPGRGAAFTVAVPLRQPAGAVAAV